MAEKAVVKSKLKGTEKWLALAQARKEERDGEEKPQVRLLQRKYGLSDSTSRSQYFVEKYPLKEKTREERRKTEEDKLLAAKK